MHQIQDIEMNTNNNYVSANILFNFFLFLFSFFPYMSSYKAWSFEYYILQNKHEKM